MCRMLHVAVGSKLPQLHFLNIDLVRRKKTSEIGSLELEKVQWHLFLKPEPFDCRPCWGVLP